MDPFSWGEAIKAALIGFGKLPGLIEDGLKRLDQLRASIEDRKIQEVRDAQNQLAREIQQVQNDEARAALARRLSQLERGNTGK